jgi:hypothetical protein
MVSGESVIGGEKIVTDPICIDTNCDICGSWDSKELLKAKGSAYHECSSCGMIFAKPMPENFFEINEEQFLKRLDLYSKKIESKRKRNRNKLAKFSMAFQCSHTRVNPWRSTGSTATAYSSGRTAEPLT